MPDSLFRFDYFGCVELLRARLAEAAPGRIQLLTGPRQVGKTTVLLELASELDDAAIYAAADAPEAALPGFWGRLWARASALAEEHEPVVVLLDEIQHLPDWAARLKAEWDRIRLQDQRVHIVATGSSALTLARGSTESLAGRFEVSTLTHWSAASLERCFGLGEEEAALEVVQMGAYPGAFELRADVPRWQAYLRDAIVEPAIGRDILALARVRRPALLRQVFSVAASSPARIVSLQKLQGQLQDRGALETISQYLGLLEQAFLVAQLEKYSGEVSRRRRAPPKLVPLSNAFCAVVDPKGIPDRQNSPERFGAWVENACLAHAWSAGQSVTYWREEPFEVDAVIEGSWGAHAVEVKTGSFAASDLRGLVELTRREPRLSPLVVCDSDQLHIAERLGLPAMSWQRFLHNGLSTSVP